MRRLDPLWSFLVASWPSHRTAGSLLPVFLLAISGLLVAGALTTALLAASLPLPLLVLLPRLLAFRPPLLSLATLALVSLLLALTFLALALIAATVTTLATPLLAASLAIPPIGVLPLLARGGSVTALFHVGHAAAFSYLLLAKFLRRRPRTLPLGRLAIVLSSTLASSLWLSLLAATAPGLGRL
jgi:hypothetical protein